MLAIILWILKIIGILLLTVFCLFLLLVCLVLFVPACYEAKKESMDGFNLAARVSWLLHIFTVCVDYEEGELNLQLKIFGIPWHRHEKQSAPKAQRQKRERKKAESRSEPAEDRKEPEKTEENQTLPEPVQESKSVENNEESTVEPGFFQKLKEFIKSFYRGCKNIRYTILRICDKINDIGKNVTKYHDIFVSDYAKNAFSLCMGQLLRILRHVHPRKFFAVIHFGVGDPALTGELIGAYSVFYPVFGKNIQIIPEFENTVFEGKFYMKGRVFVIVVLHVLWKLYFNRDLKKMIRALRKDEEDGR